MTKNELKKELDRQVLLRNGKKEITCTQALEIATRCKEKPKNIGKACDEASIKIRRCKLGCFA